MKVIRLWVYGGCLEQSGGTLPAGAAEPVGLYSLQGVQPGGCRRYSAGCVFSGRPVELISAGKIDLDTLITHRMDLDHLPDAFSLHGDPQATKIIIQP